MFPPLLLLHVNLNKTNVLSTHRIIFTYKAAGALYDSKGDRNMSGLTEYMIRTSDFRSKKYTISDGRGLMLEVNPNGSRYWIVRIYRDGKEVRRGIGTYPAISLREARKIAFTLKNEKVEDVKSKMTFAECYELYNEKRCAKMADSTKKARELRYKKYIKPYFAGLRLSKITTADIADICHKILDDGKEEVARRIYMMISQVFDFAMMEQIVNSNPALSLSKSKNFFPKHVALNYAALIDPSEIAMLLRSIEAYPNPIVRYAMQLSAYSFCRPGEIRTAEWSDLNLAERQWVIPLEKTKKRREHIVPLTKQILALLDKLKYYSGDSQWLFPSSRNDGRPMSDGTVRVALRAMGYPKEKMTAHGFRSTASSILNYFGWPHDVIEAQLAHLDTTVRGVYNRTIYLPQRRYMLQWYNDFLDALRDGTDIPAKPNLDLIYTSRQKI